MMKQLAILVLTTASLVAQTPQLPRGMLSAAEFGLVFNDSAHAIRVKTGGQNATARIPSAPADPTVPDLRLARIAGDLGLAVGSVRIDAIDTFNGLAPVAWDAGNNRFWMAPSLESVPWTIVLLSTKGGGSAGIHGTEVRSFYTDDSELPEGYPGSTRIEISPDDFSELPEVHGTPDVVAMDFFIPHIEIMGGQTIPVLMEQTATLNFSLTNASASALNLTLEYQTSSTTMPVTGGDILRADWVVNAGVGRWQNLRVAWKAADLGLAAGEDVDALAIGPRSLLGVSGSGGIQGEVVYFSVVKVAGQPLDQLLVRAAVNGVPRIGTLHRPTAKGGGNIRSTAGIPLGDDIDAICLLDPDVLRDEVLRPNRILGIPLSARNLAPGMGEGSPHVTFGVSRTRDHGFKAFYSGFEPNDPARSEYTGRWGYFLSDKWHDFPVNLGAWGQGDASRTFHIPRPALPTGVEYDLRFWLINLLTEQVVASNVIRIKG